MQLWATLIITQSAKECRLDARICQLNPTLAKCYKIIDVLHLRSDNSPLLLRFYFGSLTLVRCCQTVGHFTSEF